MNGKFTCFIYSLIIHFIHYRWVANQRILPTFDSQQNLENTEINIQDGITTMSFRRALVTTDNNNQDVDLNQCVYLLSAWDGSVIYTNPAMFGMHSNRDVFSTQLCLQDCGKYNYYYSKYINISSVTIIIVYILYYFSGALEHSK